MVSFTIINRTQQTQPTQQFKKPRICINCKYFTLENNDFTLENDEEDTKYAKCLYFEKELFLPQIDKSITKNNFIDYLVTGIRKEESKKEVDWFYCSTARSCESMCGYEGKHYKDDIYDLNKEQI
jgi:hypothetical protein